MFTLMFMIVEITVIISGCLKKRRGKNGTYDRNCCWF